MSKIVEEPMRGLIITEAAWRRLISKAEELAASKETKFAGLYILLKMKECKAEAERDMQENEEKLKKEMKE